LSAIVHALPVVEWRWSRWVASLVALILVPVAWAWQLAHGGHGCPNIETASSFAGDPQRFRDYLTSRGFGASPCQLTSLGVFHRDLTIGYVLGVGCMAVFVILWLMWWQRAWLTGGSVAASRLVLLAPVGAAADIVENIIQHVSVSLPNPDGVPQISWLATKALPVVAWVKVLAFAAVWLVVLFTLIAAFSRRRIHGARTEGVLRERRTPEGLGICCSGGGIRAASISLGALGVLERTRPDGTSIERCAGTEGILDRARFLASVSGGGYAAGAWRIARGTRRTAANPLRFEELWPAGIIGLPDDYGSLDHDAFDDPATSRCKPTLFRHLQQRREFLRTGRGGFSTSLLAAAAFLAGHLLLLVSLLVAVAWPMGRLASTSYVYGGIGCRTDTIEATTGELLVSRTAPYQVDLAANGDLPKSLCNSSRSITGNDEFMQYSLTRSRVFVSLPGRQFPIRWGLYGPAAVFGAISALLFVASLAQWNTRRRSRVRAASTGFAGAALVTGVLLVGIPLWLDVVHPWLAAHASFGALLALTSGGGVVASMLGSLRKVVRQRIAVLGGVLLAVAALLLGTNVAARAAMGKPVIIVGWLGADWWGWIALCSLTALSYLVLCPRWWSLHTLYRNRLRGAFATTRQRASAPRRLRGARRDPYQPMWPIKQHREPLLHQYANAPGPEHLICCSAARQHRTGTGVKALSFVLSPEEVVFYDVEPGAATTSRRPSASNKSLPVTAYSVPAKAWVHSLGAPCGQRAEGTVSAGMSVSGAAIAPAMGRMDKGTTMSLLAALNLRLGTWYPNPRCVRPSRTGKARYPWVRVSYMLKELLGLYDLNDHHLYVTDGGHRENLGLVELLRRRCRTIVCVDSSGDVPGSYTTLRQAVDLARVEVGAMVDLGPLRVRHAAFVSDGDPDAAHTVNLGSMSGGIRIKPPRMSAADDERPRSAHTVLKVAYFDADGEFEGEGEIIHLAAVLSEELPVELVAFSLEDPAFPHYSTGNQFLSEKQFRSLVQFGQAATACALVDEAVLTAIGAAMPAAARAEAGRCEQQVGELVGAGAATI
jgi:hypothetical protein